MRSANTRPPQSLRTKFIVALLLSGLCVALVGTWYTYQSTVEQLETAVLDRARTLGSVINHAAMVAPDLASMQHIFRRVQADEPDVISLGVYLKRDGRATVSIGLDASEKSLEQIAGTSLGKMLATALRDGRSHYFFDRAHTLTLLVPVGPHISQIDTHEGSAGDSAGDQGVPARAHGHRGALLVRMRGTSTISGVYAVMGRNLIGVLACIAVVVLLAYLLVKLHVLRPIAVIEDVGRRRRAGSNEARVPTFRNRDFAYLAETLNTLFDSRDRSQAKLAEALRQAEADRARAIAADTAKSQFLANMSHELRTPLNSIIGFSDIIGKEALGPIGAAQYKEYATDINNSGQHLLSLINDILDLSKIESGKEELIEEVVDLPAIVRSSVSLVRERAAEKCITLDVDVGEQMLPLRADRRKITQILANLLTNAIKFTDAGGKVTVSAWCDSGDACVLRVADTGIGIAPEDIPKALSQFGQIDSELSREYEGTGLGLPLTKALVELHAGTLELQSEVGEGTRVIVRFPPGRTERVRAAADETTAAAVGG